VRSVNVLLVALSLLAVACGSPRRVVVEPSALPGLTGDTWHVTGQPAPKASSDEDPATTPR
jgi:hypothetical protein